MATVRKASSRDMHRAEQAKTRSIRMSLVDGYDDEQVSKLKLFQSDAPRDNDDDEKLDPDRMMLESHDAETLVDACTVSVDAEANLPAMIPGWTTSTPTITRPCSRPSCGSRVSSQA